MINYFKSLATIIVLSFISLVVIPVFAAIIGILLLVFSPLLAYFNESSTFGEFVYKDTQLSLDF